MSQANRCLILGATGMVGQALMAEAQGRFGRVSGAARHGADQCIDLCDGIELRRSLDQLKPDLVVNAAALTAFDACEQDPVLADLLNGRSVAILAKYCADADAKLVQISTDQYYTGDGDAHHDEEANVHMLNAYGRSKYAGEQNALAAPKSLVVRTNVTGWRHWPDRPTFLEWAVDMLKAGRKITAFGDYYTSTMDSRALARAVFDLSQARHDGLFNVACREVSSKMTFISHLATCLGLGNAYIELGSVRSLGNKRAESCGLAVGKAEAALGYRLPDRAQVIDALLAGLTSG
jgi:dTDP-4-dehydrorhamnose reductase